MPDDVDFTPHHFNTESFRKRTLTSGYNFPQSSGYQQENPNQSEQNYFVPFDTGYQTHQGGYTANYSDPYYYSYDYDQQQFAPQDFPPLPASAPPMEAYEFDYVADTQQRQNLVADQQQSVVNNPSNEELSQELFDVDITGSPTQNVGDNPLMQLDNARAFANTLEANNPAPSTQSHHQPPQQGNQPVAEQPTLPSVSTFLPPQNSDSDSSGTAKKLGKKSKQGTEPTRQSTRDRRPPQHFVATHAIGEENPESDSQPFNSEVASHATTVSPKTLLEKSSESEIRQAMKEARNPDADTGSTTSFDRFLLNLAAKAKAKADKKSKPKARLEPPRVPSTSSRSSAFKIPKKSRKAKILESDED